MRKSCLNQEHDAHLWLDRADGQIAADLVSPSDRLSTRLYHIITGGPAAVSEIPI